MTRPDLTIGGQMFHLLEWFKEFSDFQRSDFLNIHLIPVSKGFFSSYLLETDNCDKNCNGSTEPGDSDHSVSNYSAQNNRDSVRPPSLFECRMKLLKEWTEQWSNNDFMDFFRRLDAVDHRFVRQVFRLYFHQQNIDSFQTFQEKIAADNDFVQNFELDDSLFELTIESTKDECFYSIINVDNEQMMGHVGTDDSLHKNDDVADDQDTGSDHVSAAAAVVVEDVPSDVKGHDKDDDDDYEADDSQQPEQKNQQTEADERNEMENNQ